MSKSIPLRRYSLRGGVDVNMYNTLLEPDFALNVDSENYTDEEEKAIWDRFDIDAYRKKGTGYRHSATQRENRTGVRFLQWYSDT